MLLDVSKTGVRAGAHFIGFVASKLGQLFWGGRGNVGGGGGAATHAGASPASSFPSTFFRDRKPDPQAMVTPGITDREWSIPTKGPTQCRSQFAAPFFLHRDCPHLHPLPTVHGDDGTQHALDLATRKLTKSFQVPHACLCFARVQPSGAPSIPRAEQRRNGPQLCRVNAPQHPWATRRRHPATHIQARGVVHADLTSPPPLFALPFNPAPRQHARTPAQGSKTLRAPRTLSHRGILV